MAITVTPVTSQFVNAPYFEAHRTTERTMTMQSTSQTHKTFGHSMAALSGLVTGAAMAAVSILLLALMAI